MPEQKITRGWSKIEKLPEKEEKKAKKEIFEKGEGHAKGIAPPKGGGEGEWNLLYVNFLNTPDGWTYGHRDVGDTRYWLLSYDGKVALTFYWSPEELLPAPYGPFDEKTTKKVNAESREHHAKRTRVTIRVDWKVKWNWSEKIPSVNKTHVPFDPSDPKHPRSAYPWIKWPEGKWMGPDHKNIRFDPEGHDNAVDIEPLAPVPVGSGGQIIASSTARQDLTGGTYRAGSTPNGTSILTPGQANAFNYEATRTPSPVNGEIPLNVHRGPQGQPNISLR